MHINKYLDEERGRNGRMENTTYLIYGPYFVNGGKFRYINFIREARDVALFYALQVL